MAADARETEQVGRDHVVAGAQQADEHDREDDGGRRQTVGPELAVRPDPEHQRDGADEDQRAHDAAASSAALPLCVEAGPPEDEHHHETQEGQPVGLDTPDRAPEDVLAVEQRAKDERGVQAEDQAAQVEHDQRDDAGGAAEERRDRAAEDLRRPGSDVAERPGCRRRPGRLSRRRFLRSH
jgi:hypothetical protein